MKKNVNIIVACDLNGAIGYKNKLLWHIPEDLKFFKKTTIGNTIIMGMNTFNSIGKALPDRENIVLTSTPENYPDLNADDNIILIKTIEEAIEISSHNKIFIIGGESVYNTILSPCYFNLIDTIYLTEIEHSFKKYDKLFPKYIINEQFIGEITNKRKTKDYNLTFYKYKKK